MKVIKYILPISIFFLCAFGVKEITEVTKLNKKIEKRVVKLFGTVALLAERQTTPAMYQLSSSIITSFDVSIDDDYQGLVIYSVTPVCFFGGCSIYTDQSKSISREEVKHIIYFNAENEILHIDIIDFESNYGYEISAKWWLKQFYDQIPGKFTLGQEIDGISGATVSCEQFIESINQLEEIVKVTQSSIK